MSGNVIKSVKTVNSVRCVYVPVLYVAPAKGTGLG